MDQIDKGLYLGGIEALLAGDFQETLKQRGIGHVLALGLRPLEKLTKMPEISYHFERVNDTCSQDLLGTAILQTCVEFVENALSSGNSGAVFVHCELGISRSATVVVAYLMRKYYWTVDRALKYVAASRSIVCPNEGFMTQLRIFQSLNYKFDSDRLKTNIDYRHFLLTKDVHPKFFGTNSGSVEIFKRMETNLQNEIDDCRAKLDNATQKCKNFDAKNDPDRSNDSEDIVRPKFFGTSGTAVEIFKRIETNLQNTNDCLVKFDTAQKNSTFDRRAKNDDAPAVEDAASKTVHQNYSRTGGNNQIPNFIDGDDNDEKSSSEEKGATMEKCLYRCARCRQVLFKDGDLLENHNKNDGTRCEIGYGRLLRPLDWMPTEKMQGKLYCPGGKCKEKLGSIDWKGRRCKEMGCGTPVVPWIFIANERVDGQRRQQILSPTLLKPPPFPSKRSSSR